MYTYDALDRHFALYVHEKFDIPHAPRISFHIMTEI